MKYLFENAMKPVKDEAFKENFIPIAAGGSGP